MANNYENLSSEELKKLFIKTIDSWIVSQRKPENGLFYTAANSIRATVTNLYNFKTASGKLYCGKFIQSQDAVTRRSMIEVSLSTIRNEEVNDLTIRLSNMYRNLVLSMSQTRSQRISTIEAIKNGTELPSFKIVVTNETIVGSSNTVALNASPPPTGPENESPLHPLDKYPDIICISKPGLLGDDVIVDDENDTIKDYYGEYQMAWAKNELNRDKDASYFLKTADNYVLEFRRFTYKNKTEWDDALPEILKPIIPILELVASSKGVLKDNIVEDNFWILVDVNNPPGGFPPAGGPRSIWQFRTVAEDINGPWIDRSGQEVKLKIIGKPCDCKKIIEVPEPETSR